MHSSRMCTARCSGCLSCHACPHHAHSLAMHAPHYACPPPCMPPAMHAPCHACHPTIHVPLPYMPSPHNTCPLSHMSPCHASLPHTPPAMHAPLPQPPILSCTCPTRGQTDTCENITREYRATMGQAVIG